LKTSVPSVVAQMAMALMLWLDGMMMMMSGGPEEKTFRATTVVYTVYKGVRV
jgi:hypothetical protein